MESKINEHIRFRFAPSPTGGLHVGTARTALFNWLSARSLGGQLVLRIEDTDIKRSKKEYENSIINDLKWLGIEWDEFYRQSERMNIYLREARRLIKEGKAYMCFCSSERLESLKNSLISEGKPPGYDNKCRNLDKNEIDKNLAENKPYTIRFKVEPCEIVFNDLIRGQIKFSSEVISDFVLIKSDGTPSYNFAVVIDDHDMKISHVLRGEDHITNTARQIMLFRSLGYDIPEFAHLSMILGKDGAKLSKRHGATTITQYKKEGYLSEAIANYLSLLSWAPKDGNEIFIMNNIFDKFKIGDVSKNPAIFDVDKLNWINGMHIRMKNTSELKELLEPFLSDKTFRMSCQQSEDNKEKVLKIIDAFKDKVKTLKEIMYLAEDFYIEKIESYEDAALEILKTETGLKVIDLFLKKLEENKETDKDEITEDKAKEIINEISNELKEYKINGKMLYMPIRASVTGKVHGPELPKVISILGAGCCIERVKQTKDFIENKIKI